MSAASSSSLAAWYVLPLLPFTLTSTLPQSRHPSSSSTSTTTTTTTRISPAPDRDRIHPMGRLRNSDPCLWPFPTASDLRLRLSAASAMQSRVALRTNPSSPFLHDVANVSTSSWARSQPPTPALGHHTPPSNPSPPSKLILMPTVRIPRPPPGGPSSPTKSPRLRPAPPKISRARSGSIAGTPEPPPTADVGIDWFGRPCKFEIVQDQLEIAGYQIYAVEKWVTERTRPVVTLAVYTGDRRHKITVTAFSLPATLSPADAQTEWDGAMRDLRQAGARPRETSEGVLMVTSLANFRSDYTIVHIPSGHFLQARERLYTNINLLRMGCSGRTALTLEEPSDTTKDRFIGMYRIQDRIRTPELFSATILELVQLVQAGLSLFGMFDSSPDARDGLLCDLTVEGIQRWITDVGEPCMGVEPMERIADPVVVCALLSMIAGARAKLYVLGFSQVLPKDPLVDTQSFLHAVSTFQNSRLCISPSHSLTPYLTADTVDAIDAAYDKSRQRETFKVSRALKTKLDDLTADLLTSTAPAITAGSATAHGYLSADATLDIGEFARMMEKRGKVSVPSLRYLWTGRPGHMDKNVREKEKLWSDAEKEREKEREREREREKEREKEKEVGERLDEFSADDDTDRMKKVQKKLESWAGFNRKKQSVDFTVKGTRTPIGNDSQLWQTPVPEVVISKDVNEDEDILSSGQISPISGPRGMYLDTGAPTAATSTTHFSDYDRRISEFNHRRPSRPSYQRVTSWSDPRSAKGTVPDGSSLTESLSEASAEERPAHLREETIKPTASPSLRRRRLVEPSVTRRRSFDDAFNLWNARLLPVDWLKIDVDLCGQLLIMRRRERHLEDVVATLNVLTGMLSETNANLREDYQAHQPGLLDAEARTKIVAEIESARGKADTMLQEANALDYESAQFYATHLWQGVAPQRHKVLAMRQKVFGSGRRAPGAIGRFSRLQHTLAGEERRVDWLGRTAEEAVEEEGLSEVAPPEEEESVVEHQAMKPTWLLKFFESWGTRWGGVGRKKAGVAPDHPDPSRSPTVEPEQAVGTTTALEHVTEGEEDTVTAGSEEEEDDLTPTAGPVNVTEPS
ncbi:hypothetical protein OF83DRAFT_1102938 [Amylostereum chailletii]|nr:hypothetical protein OF83DRAFT_1102938 [Amylostereum chailletii]